MHASKSCVLDDASFRLGLRLCCADSWVSDWIGDATKWYSRGIKCHLRGES